jgi:hypothetical protein
MTEITEKIRHMSSWERKFLSPTPESRIRCQLVKKHVEAKCKEKYWTMDMNINWGQWEVGGAKKRARGENMIKVH